VGFETPASPAGICIVSAVLSSCIRYQPQHVRLHGEHTSVGKVHLIDPQLQDPSVRYPVSIPVRSHGLQESGAPLSPVRVCYAGGVVWCRRVTTERERGVINCKSPEACGCKLGSHGPFVPMVGV
jgi:hypothetical protein